MSIYKNRNKEEPLNYRGGGGLVGSGQAYQLWIPSSSPGTCCDGHFSLLIPPGGLRSPTCCHNTILDETANLTSATNGRRPTSKASI